MEHSEFSVSAAQLSAFDQLVASVAEDAALWERMGNIFEVLIEGGYEPALAFARGKLDGETQAHAEANWEAATLDEKITRMKFHVHLLRIIIARVVTDEHLHFVDAADPLGVVSAEA